MPTTRILLVRHGDSHHKADGVNGGPRGCRGLTDLGRAQAARLRDRLIGEGVLPEAVTAVYSSVIPRAAETARVLADAVIEDCGLCTYHTAEWADGMSWEQLRRDHFRPDGGLFHPFQDGNESWAELVLRVSRALTSIAGRHAGHTVVVVTHAEAVEASLIGFGSLPIYRDFDVRVAPTSITEWSTRDDPSASWVPERHPSLPVRWTLIRFNDAAHVA